MTAHHRFARLAKPDLARLRAVSASVAALAVAAVAVAAVAVAALASCTSEVQTRRYSRAQAQKSLAQLEQPGLVIGEFKLAAKDPVLDGDTVKVAGLDTTLRLLGIDTEETFKNEDDRRAAADDFAEYLRKKRGDRKNPAKAATPMGEEAKKWAKQFFKGVDTIRLERDHPREVRGLYGRYLSYILVEHDGAWMNYNVECVRAGMSPYFTKYGYSRRFHDQFLVAQRQAQKAQRGIWSPDAQKYPDYDERLSWWNARAEFIRAFEKEAGEREHYIPLTRWDSLQRLEAHEGREVVVLGTVARVKLGQRGPSKVFLSRRRSSSFPIVFFDKDVMGNTGIADARGEFVRVRGTVTKYFNKYRKSDELQVVVTLPGQVQVSEIPPFDPGSGDTSASIESASR